MTTASMQLMQMITGGVVAQTIGVAAELGIADRLADKPQTAAELATATGSNEEKLFRLLRFLAGIGVFQVNSAGVWNLTPLAEVLRSDVEGSVLAGARMMGRVARVTPRLLENVRTGKCAYNLTFGKSLFEDLGNKPEDAAIFDAAMSSFHGSETNAVLDAYSYEGISTLADIGGGSGAVLMATLQRYPALHGILFDQPAVVERAAPAIRAAGLSARCSVQGGNFFDAVPAGADAYSMRHILHDWADDVCLQILSNIRKVIPASGRLLIIETIVPEGNDPSPSKLFDILMMMFPDGMERTEAQFRKLLDQAGFKVASITATPSPVSVIDARPS